MDDEEEDGERKQESPEDDESEEMFVNLPHKRLMQGNGKKVLKIQDDSSEEEGSSGS